MLTVSPRSSPLCACFPPADCEEILTKCQDGNFSDFCEDLTDDSGCVAISGAARAVASAASAAAALLLAAVL